MKNSTVINTCLQILFAVVRYGLMAASYRNISLADVGAVNSLLFYVTASTFLAGFEIHQTVNRRLILGESSEVSYGADRIVLATLVIAACSYIIGLTSIRNHGLNSLLVITALISVEYLCLEIGRVLISKGQFLYVTFTGFIRSTGPFFFFLSNDSSLDGMIINWLIASLLSLVLMLGILWRRADVHFRFRRLGRSELATSAAFFILGAYAALTPSIERSLVGSWLTAEDLGNFALGMTFVSGADLLLQGALWQPKLRLLSQQFASDDGFKSSAKGYIKVVLLTYFISMFGTMFLSGPILAIMNKMALSTSVIAGCFLLGASKSLYTLIFYYRYSRSEERYLFAPQLLIAAATALCIVGGSLFGATLGIITCVLGLSLIAGLLSYLFTLSHRPIRPASLA